MADRSVSFLESTLKDGTVRRKIVVDGYVYHKDKVSKANPEISFWECDLARHHHCKACIHVQDDAILNMVGEHNHAPDKAKVCHLLLVLSQLLLSPYKRDVPLFIFALYEAV